MFATLRGKIEALRVAGPRACEAAAPRIEDRAREDSRTKRGNVPSYGDRFGDIATTARPLSDGVEVTAANWVMRRAVKLGQPAAWATILADALREEVE